MQLSLKLLKKLKLFPGYILFFTLFFNTTFLNAQTYPDHTLLLYSSNLDAAGNTSIGYVTNNGGSFQSGGGWKSTSTSSQLKITLPTGLPFEGTMVVQVTNFDPVSQNVGAKHQIINLYSQENGSKDIFYTTGSWWNIRTGTSYSDGPGVAGFKFLAAPQHLDSREEVRIMQSATWDLGAIYEFKIVWTTTNIYCVLDNNLKATLNFNNQVEPFRWIFLGKDNVYIGMPGVIYKNVKIYTKDSGGTPSTEIFFTNVTDGSGTIGYNGSGYGHGASFADVDQDGYYDLFVSNGLWDSQVPDLLYMNQGGLSFAEVASSKGTADTGMTHAIVTADFDNDGDLDAYFANMQETDGSALGRDAMYRNDGTGSFTNITDWAGISTDLNRAKGAVAADFNNDGFMDMYINDAENPNKMYFNDGTGRMTLVTRGAEGDSEIKQGVTVADVDNDGDVDIYCCRREANNHLFINDGSGNFTEDAAARGVNLDGRSKGATFADYDNDGDLDLFVMNEKMTTDTDLPYLRVYVNNGSGVFSDASAAMGIRVSGYSPVFLDVENDADLDLVLLRNDEKEPGTRPELYLNDGTGTLTLQSSTGVEVGTVDPRAGAYADIDNDGKLDLYFACADGQNYLLHNESVTSYNWIDILCHGPAGDYGGFGTKVKVYERGYINNSSKMLGFQQSVSNTAYISQNQTALHFGAAANDTVDIVAQFADNSILELQNIPVNQTIDVSRVFANIKILLEGAYNSSGLMTTSITVPTSSPYTQDPAYPNRGVSSMPANIIDWVLVQLYNTSKDSIIATKSALLKNNGQIVADDGTTTQIIMNAVADSYYVAVRHRNHLTIMTKDPVYFDWTTTTNINFISDSTLYHSASSAKKQESTYWCVCAGDVNQDGEITTTDYTTWYNSARIGESGYKVSDINLDGQVTTSDYTIWYNNARLGASSNLP